VRAVRQEAEQIKACIGQFLHNQLKLELSPAKTLITHGRTQAARFLGYQIVILHADHKHDRRGHRSINAAIGLKVPVDVIRAKCAPYLHHGRPIRRTERIVDTDFSIVAQFQAEFRGVAEYYRLAFNRHRLGQLKYVMERSLTKTLARKYRIRVAQVYRHYRAVLDTEHGPRRGLQVTVHRDDGRSPLVAQWGGISLARDTTPRPLNDNPPRIWSNRRSELVQRLLADACELCGSGNQVEVHHIRHSKTSTPRGRNTSPNGSCGWQHAAARPSSSAASAIRTSMLDVLHGEHDEHWRAGCHGKRARPVRRGAVGKGPGQGHLAGGRLHSARGPGKRTGSNPGTAPRAYSANPVGLTGRHDFSGLARPLNPKPTWRLLKSSHI
jgi:Type II intron maturase